MTKWEYKQAIHVPDLNLNDYGEEGWELVSVIVRNTHTIYYFKRPLPPDLFSYKSPL